MNSRSLRFYFLKIALITLISISCIFSQSQNLRELSTSEVSYDSGNILKLASLEVKCEDNEVLTYWKLERNNGKMHIRYKCLMHFSIKYTSEIRYTPWNAINVDKNHSLNFLDRHRVVCDIDQGIGAFQMEVTNNNTAIRFRYRCNDIDYKAQMNRTTIWRNTNFGEVQNLDVHEIFGFEKNSDIVVLRGWAMRTKYIYRWCTVFCDSYHLIKFEIFFQSLAPAHEKIVLAPGDF